MFTNNVGVSLHGIVLLTRCASRGQGTCRCGREHRVVQRGGAITWHGDVQADGADVGLFHQLRERLPPASECTRVEWAK